MSTFKSLKHLKSKVKLLIANVSNYFEKHSGGGEAAHHIFNRLFRQLGSAEPFSKYEKNYKKPVHFRRRNFRNGGKYKPVDDCDEGVIRNNVQEIYIQRHQLPTSNNLLSVL